MTNQTIKRRSSLQVQFAAIHALYMRELLTRFGHYRLGYVWAIIEPGLIVFLKTVFFTAVFGRVIGGMSYGLFLVNGILPFFMIMRSATRSLGAVDANRGLFVYRAVRPIDTVIARSLLEASLYFNLYILFMFGLWWSGQPISFSYIPMILLCWFTLFFFGLGISFVFMTLGSFSKELSKFVGSFSIIFYIMSGIMYSVRSLPQQYQEIILWNPIIHGIEIIRHSVHPAYLDDHVSYFYLLKATVVVLFLGLFLYKTREKKMLTMR